MNPRISAALVALAVAATPLAAQDSIENDYPTDARVDYVFGCMGSNGQSQPVMKKCSCSIDHIARILPYERYVQAETIIRTLQVGGEKVAPLRASARHKAMIADLRRAQAEADILCFQ